jgi:hypothetical protein
MGAMSRLWDLADVRILANEADAFAVRMLRNVEATDKLAHDGSRVGQRPLESTRRQPYENEFFVVGQMVITLKDGLL